MSASLRERGVKVVLLDVEGTTTPISFVHDVLFPYARQHMRAYVDSVITSQQLTELQSLLHAEYRVDLSRGESLPRWSNDSGQLRDSIAAYCLWLMDRDRKSPGLKLLQGWIWSRGYENGDLKGEVFDDVPPAFRRWREAGQRIAIFSSGSVLAQQLIFRHTKHGDLGKFIQNYFDTGVGAKREDSSYAAITRSLAVSAAEILFLSDIIAELDAARSAGLQVALAVRPGNASEAGGPSLETVRSFDSLTA